MVCHILCDLNQILLYYLFPHIPKPHLNMTGSSEWKEERQIYYHTHRFHINGKQIIASIYDHLLCNVYTHSTSISFVVEFSTLRVLKERLICIYFVWLGMYINPFDFPPWRRSWYPIRIVWYDESLYTHIAWCLRRENTIYNAAHWKHRKPLGAKMSME